MNIRFYQITTTLIALGVISAGTSAILYFMRLPIFDQVSLAWVFCAGLLSAAVAAASVAVRSIWENGQ